MPRARTGTLDLRVDGYWAKVTVEGLDYRPKFKLDTFNKPLATRKKNKIVALINAGVIKIEDRHAIAHVAKTTTFADFRGPWIETRKAAAIASVASEASLLKYVAGALDALALEDIDSDKISEALEIASRAMVKRGKNTPAEPIRKGTVEHIRRLLNRMFRRAKRDKLIASNPVPDSEMPPMRQVDRERETLTDDEISRLMNHPDVDLEFKVLAIASRAVGGQRTGDLVGWDWSEIDTVDFAWCYVKRQKTGKPQKFTLPDVVKPSLRKWHELAKKPSEGPVFPIRKGKRKGEARRRYVSFAARLRRALKAAGITRRGLFAKTPSTLPVDFHSFRRAFCTALGGLEMSTSAAMALAGHKDAKTHLGYVRKSAESMPMPEGALPKLNVRIGTQTSPPGDDSTDGGDDDTRSL